MAYSKSDGKGLERDRTVASVLVPCIEATADGAVLVCNDSHGFIETGLRENGVSVASWCRLATAEHDAHPWPSIGSYSAAVLRMPRDKGAFELALHAVCSVLPPHAPVWVVGANDEGIKSAPRLMSTVLHAVDTMDTRKHCRVSRGATPMAGTPIRGALSDWASVVNLAIGTEQTAHTVFPGVFAKGRLDPATALLLACIEPPKGGSAVLDYACGAGVIGGWLLRRDPTLTLTQLDADAIAAEAASINVKEAHTIVGASLHAVPAGIQYDCIVSNPPIHVGTSRDYGVLRDLVSMSPKRLKPRGKLWVVVQRQAQLEPLLRSRFSRVAIASEDARFRVWVAS